MGRGREGDTEGGKEGGKNLHTEGLLKEGRKDRTYNMSE